MMSAIPGTLLIVDDEAAHVAALCNTLGDWGYATVGCTSAEDALEKIAHTAFDLLLTDLQMPSMDGITLLSAAQQIQPDIVGVLMTGHGSVGTAVEAMKAGALDYILKPFKLSIALPVLARALEIRRLRVQNAQLQQKLSGKLAELEIANSDLHAFNRTICHDLRNPLALVDSYAMLLQQRFPGQMPTDAQQLVARIHEIAQHMRALIAALFEFAQLGRRAVGRAELDMSAIAHEVVQELSPLYVERSVDVRIEALPPCIGDRVLIKQVVANLVSNAFKFTRTRERAKIVLTSERDEAGQVVYVVRDNGVGFDSAHAQALFGVFQRLHGEAQFEGSGLGLSIAHRIIQRHGGRIWADSQVEAGATFRFTVPDAGPSEQQDALDASAHGA